MSAHIEGDYSIQGVAKVEIEILEYDGPGYKEQIDFNGWRVAIANYKVELEEQNLCFLERHLETEEAFILVEGFAGLLVGEDRKRYVLEKGKLYNVKRGVWHRVFMKEHAKVVIVENMDTGKHNTEYMEFGKN